MFRIQLITILFFFPLFFYAQQTPICQLSGDTLFPMARLTAFKVDNTWQKSLTDVQTDSTFTPMTHDIYKMGGTNPRNIWVKFQIKKETTKEAYLELNTGITDTLILYAIDSQGTIYTQRIGKNFAFSERHIKTNRQVFSLMGEKDALMTYYLNMKSQFPVSIRMRVGTVGAFSVENHASDLLHGIFVGIIFIVALFNLFFFISSREWFYGFYVGYAVFILGTVLRFDGYLFQYLHPNFPAFNNVGFYFHGLAGVFGIFFSRNFLKTKQHTPRLDKGLLFFMAFYVLNIGLAAVGLYELNILSV